MTSTDSVAAVRSWAGSASSIVALTGAGLSTASGIPDFRGPQGVWTQNPDAARLFEFDAYMQDASVREQVWQMRRHAPAFEAAPNAGHHALADLHPSGRLRAIVTQNVDGLHQRAGSPTSAVLEIHGTIRYVECMTCGLKMPTEEIFSRLDAGESDPHCTVCKGILKTATISFGQSLKPTVLAAATDAARAADLFLAIGTSLSVYPAAGLPEIARSHGARVVIINAEPTDQDHLADAIIRDAIADVLPALLA